MLSAAMGVPRGSEAGLLPRRCTLRAHLHRIEAAVVRLRTRPVVGVPVASPSGMGRRILILVCLILAVAGCAGLTQLAQFVQAPRFEQADNQPAELRFIQPSRSMPAGGAGVRIWLEV